ncbi:methylenetetrahydrofolate reductase [NAD(P)H] [Oryzomonas japonica]|uniref:Methylenetetrahydrofolate reductase n=1 Tax=Oryzomonas japonica TaxID=2603858 RepID=A0A7J4ZMA9_9BACT|nr:methylenetetrahydrofolate reductase [Oryzomonas japonica]KAB0663755.1 methylenetetrahydrofolate reductase [NAD(P)H] [Oryzomonas japonica]
MKIIDIIIPDKPFLSLEFFPPKERSEWPAFFHTVDRLKEVNPLFCSVTYGAGGSTHGDSLEIVGRLKQEHGLETMAHLTCVGAHEDDVRTFLDQLTRAGGDNVLALRGDLPQDSTPKSSPHRPLAHASDLVALIRDSHPHVGLGVAAYPEVHPEAASTAADLAYLKLKLDHGADFAITQLFFDNRIYFDFVRNARDHGITKPIIPGILPVVSLKVIKRIVSLCGTVMPPDFMAQLEEADRRGGAAEVQKLGVAHARRQTEELLAGGAPGVHLYTLNRADAVLEVTNGLCPPQGATP